MQIFRKSVNIVFLVPKTQYLVQIKRTRTRVCRGSAYAFMHRPTGERIPPTDTLITLADFYGVSLDYIVGRTDNPKINK